MDIDCPQHSKQKISWVCLEKVCQQRVMCSTCAVKVHERSHKLEELTNLLENGILSTYISNQRNSSQGLKLLVDGEPEQIQIEEPNHEDHLAQAIQRCLRAVARKIDQTKKELLIKAEDLKTKNEIDRQKIISELAQYDRKLKNSADLAVDIDKAFLSIGSFVNRRESDLIQSKESDILKKKIQLVGLMKENFLKMIKTYFHNQFTAEFCHLFDIQLETLNQKEVEDVNGFLDYVDNKWNQDYKNIQSTIEKFIQRLNEGLKYAIQIPIEEKPKPIVQPFKSPLKQVPQVYQAPQFVPQTPYNPMYTQPFYYYPQVVMQPQQFASPRKHEPDGMPDHFTKSQVMVYDEPIQKKNIKIEPFDKIQDLGGGAYGRVIRCRRKNGEEQYAVKMISKKLLKMNEKQHHVYVEKEVLQELKHPGIVVLSSTFQDKENLYFVLELCGDPLSEYLKLYHLKLPMMTIRFYIAEIVMILEYIHSKGFVHRDIKPENLLLSHDKHLKLIDFGTTSIYDPTKVTPSRLDKIEKCKQDFKQRDQSRSKRANSLEGTSAYLSPEMINDIKCGPAADLWALGCVCYRMIAGHVPFQSEQEDQLFDNITNQQLVFPKNIPDVAQDFIRQLMAKNPEDRLQNYNKIKMHPFFDGINFIDMWQQKPPSLEGRQTRKSKTFIGGAPIVQEVIIFEEILLKDSGVIIDYFTPRHLVLTLLNGKPQIHYTNPKLNDKQTNINITPLLKCQLLKSDRFVIIDEEKVKYIFKSPKAAEWLKYITDIQQTYNYN